MSLTQTQITMRQFADMLSATPPDGVTRTSFNYFDVHHFTAGPSEGKVVVEDLDETYLVLSQQSKG